MRKNLDKIIVLICLISTIARYSLDSYLPSLPAIEAYFSATHFTAQLTLTAYLLGFSVSQLVHGPLSDQYGRRKIIIYGLSIFIGSSLLAVFVNSIYELILWRLLAGIGAGAAAVLNRAIASDNYQGADFANAWAYTTSTLTFVLILAPLIGGFIQDNFTWQANIVFTAAYVGCILFILFKYLPETNKYRGQYRLKPGYVLRDYFTMLFNKIFISNLLCYTCAFAGLIAYFQTSPFLFINTLGYSATQYGLISLYIAASYFLSGLLIQRLIHKLGTQFMLVSGLILMGLAGILMLLSYLGDLLNLYGILIPAIIYVIGARFVIPNAMAGSLGEFPKQAGCAAALIGFVQMLGSAVTSFFISFFYQENQLLLAFTFILLAGIALLCFKYMTHKKRYLPHAN